MTYIAGNDGGYGCLTVRQILDIFGPTTAGDTGYKEPTDAQIYFDVSTATPPKPEPPIDNRHLRRLKAAHRRQDDRRRKRRDKRN